MEKQTNTDESRMVEEFSKPEAELSPQELANVQLVQKTIKRYQTKIADMQLPPYPGSNSSKNNANKTKRSSLNLNNSTITST